jgi:hypothetical protein
VGNRNLNDPRVKVDDKVKCKVSKVNEVTAERMEWGAKTNETVCQFKIEKS